MLRTEALGAASAPFSPKGAPSPLPLPCHRALTTSKLCSWPGGGEKVVVAARACCSGFISVRCQPPCEVKEQRSSGGEAAAQAGSPSHDPVITAVSLSYFVPTLERFFHIRGK